MSCGSRSSKRGIGWVRTKMFGCRYIHCRGTTSSLPSSQPQAFTLPSPIPQWPQGQGFASGIINLGEIEVTELTQLEFVWWCTGATFYKPTNIPGGFSCLGHYCQPNKQHSRSSVLVARISPTIHVQLLGEDPDRDQGPALLKPVDYTLVWSSDDRNPDRSHQPGYFWAPKSPEGYRSLGFVVTTSSLKPSLDEVSCVRSDLTDECEACRLMVETQSKFLRIPFRVWRMRPCHRGLGGKGVPVGSFYCSSALMDKKKLLEIVCLKNFEPLSCSMPNLEQIHALISHYGPTLFFHPDEKYLPSSVSWFFDNGALLYRKGRMDGEPIDSVGSNLPVGGENDGEYWLDLPGRNDGRRELVKHGDLRSAELYVHVKPALGGTHTDMQMWVFCPFNGPGTLKVGPMNLSLGKIGEHVGDWEHFTLRVSNFRGELRSVYFSQHNGGVWVDASELEYVEGNRAAVYSSRGGHASYSCPGCYLQGSSKLGIGIRNDCARSGLNVDASKRYQIVAAEYLGEGNDGVEPPQWLKFMREWGPKVVYDSRAELDKVLRRLPATLRYPAVKFFGKFPVELYGEEGPTGPKEKNNWEGDERW